VGFNKKPLLKEEKAKVRKQGLTLSKREWCIYSHYTCSVTESKKKSLSASWGLLGKGHTPKGGGGM
jgi:hypothetical protein